MLKIPFQKDSETGNSCTVDLDIGGQDKKMVELLSHTIADSTRLLKESGKWPEYREMFVYDLTQVYNSFHYSYLLNSMPYIGNYLENIRFGAYNMMFFVFADIDILFSPELKKNELAHLREMVLLGQEMARLSNWIGTWERELTELDMTSGILSLAFCRQIVKWEDMLSSSNRKKTGKEKIIAADLENELKQEWETIRLNLLTKAPPLTSVSVPQYVDGLEMVMIAHLASKGIV